MTDTLARWEKWPALALVAAAGLNTAVWYVGVPLAGYLPLATQVMLTLAAVASVIAIDGALIATIAGMREGRRSRWSTANIVVCALFTGLAALAAHTLPDIGPWLHGLFALTIVTYAMHLAQPRTNVNQHIESLQAELAATRAELDALRNQPPILIDTPQPRLVDTRPDVLRWRDDDKLTFDAIGERLGVTRQAAQARYHKAKREG